MDILGDLIENKKSLQNRYQSVWTVVNTRTQQGTSVGSGVVRRGGGRLTAVVVCLRKSRSQSVTWSRDVATPCISLSLSRPLAT